MQQADTVQLAKDRVLLITEFWRVNGNVSLLSPCIVNFIALLM